MVCSLVTFTQWERATALNRHLYINSPEQRVSHTSWMYTPQPHMCWTLTVRRFHGALWPCFIHICDVLPGSGWGIMSPSVPTPSPIPPPRSPTIHISYNEPAALIQSVSSYSLRTAAQSHVVGAGLCLTYSQPSLSARGSSYSVHRNDFLWLLCRCGVHLVLYHMQRGI